ncbi:MULTISPECIES: PepSY-like domain-containing protein [Niastella]|uniref:PepSY-like domain-containing protein n=1 Tax=Niastella soli TaxID=2821487 RepID=A0ABS3YSZ4_9BACT|nr:PepSY-like domain-containing protein [Niastella soli]MBO9201019.1 PepSY-like domain-containing protein [Niastella soli]
MKKTLLAILLSAGVMMSAVAQDTKESDVPTAVKTSFKSAFSNAKDVEWKKKEGNYKAKFEINGTDYIAYYSADGKIISKGLKIRRSELPAAVTDAVKNGYAGRTIDNVYRMDKNGTAYYLVKLEGDPDTKVLFTADGQVAKEKID